MFFNSNPVSQRQTKSFLCFIWMPFSCKSVRHCPLRPPPSKHEEGPTRLHLQLSWDLYSSVEYLTAKASTLEDMMGKWPSENIYNMGEITGILPPIFFMLVEWITADHVVTIFAIQRKLCVSVLLRGLVHSISFFPLCFTESNFLQLNLSLWFFAFAVNSVQLL